MIVKVAKGYLVAVMQTSVDGFTETWYSLPHSSCKLTTLYFADGING